jgi:hypothetical protein
MATKQDISQILDRVYANALFEDHKSAFRNPDNLLLKIDDFKSCPASWNRLVSKNLLYPKDTVFSFI